ncbi:MAG TPA: amidase domain-containing protein [Oscillospiraceae bacterium]|nr:amidase domain-containing protein [Oscillospiraceae bacterium]HXK77143.1 amidase domain-containing protein [Oscillospiraceae bacterium]
MKKLIALMLGILMMTGCFGTKNVSEESVLTGMSSLVEEAEQEEDVYDPGENLTAEETAEAYLEQMYLSYCRNELIDFTAILDTSEREIQYILLWMEALLQRRLLLAESGLCWVDTEKKPYTVTYIGQYDVEDERLWHLGKLAPEEDEDAVVLHFVVEGEEGEAYPPILAVGAQHSILLRKEGGVWKVAYHYFPGALQKFSSSEGLYGRSDEEVLAELEAEFAASEEPKTVSSDMEVPSGAAIYDGTLAAAYAQEYLTEKNSDFYDIGDWQGNCQNYVSQCVWWGFSAGMEPSVGAYDNMTISWFAGSGGGSDAWEGVNSFWSYINNQNSALKVSFPQGVSELRVGDVVQIRSLGGDSDSGNFNHALIVVDAEKRILAQNSPGCLLCYSDLLNAETRFIRPEYLIP